MHTEVQQSMKSLQMSVVDFLFRKVSFWKFVVVSTTCSTGFPLSHMRSIATSLLQMMSSGGMLARNLKGGTANVVREAQFQEID